MKILFIGKPGAGKGTITQNLMKEDSNFLQLSTGDLLREEVKRGTPLGKEIDELLKQGKFATDDTIFSMVGDFLETHKSKNIIFDGYPRNLKQAQVCDEQNLKFDLIFHIKVSDEIIIDRITNRLVHQPSGRIYNTKTSPPKNSGIDDITGEPLTQRNDDKPEVLGSRLNLYYNTTIPVLEYYEAKQPIIEIDGLQPLEEQIFIVQKNILEKKQEIYQKKSNKSLKP